MKILYSITKSEIGGAQVQVLQLAHHMKSIGHEVAVISSPFGWLEKELEKQGIKFYANKYFSNSYNPFRLIKAFRRVNSVVSNFKPDLVHVHSSFAGIITRLVVRGKIPTIFTAHSWAFTKGAKQSRKIIAPIAERFVSRYTNKIITVSEYDRQLAIQYNIINSEKIITIYNGVSDIKGQHTRENTLLSIGRLAYPKDFLLLIKSFIKANIPEAKLLIVGDGPDRDKIDNFINKNNLSSKVILLGELSQEMIYDQLLKSRAFILVSKHEGLPLSILEAMSSGLPIVASSVGGIVEQINKESGILVKNNINDISNAIKLIIDQDISKKLGKSAREQYEEKFTLVKFLNNTEAVYREVLPS